MAQYRSFEFRQETILKNCEDEGFPTFVCLQFFENDPNFIINYKTCLENEKEDQKKCFFVGRGYSSCIDSLESYKVTLDTSSCLFAQSGYGECVNDAKRNGFSAALCLGAGEEYITCREEYSYDKCLEITSFSSYKLCLKRGHPSSSCNTAGKGFAQCLDATALPDAVCLKANDGMKDCLEDRATRGHPQKFCLNASSNYLFCRSQSGDYSIDNSPKNCLGLSL